MGEMTESRAIEFVQGIMFNNANNLYDLGFPPQVHESTLEDYKEIGKYLLIDRTKGSRSLPFWTRELGVRNVNYVAVQWVTYMGEIRARFLPVAEFTRLMNDGKRLGFSRGNTGTLQNDFITPVVNTTGQIYAEPDLKSLKVAAPMRWSDARQSQQMARKVVLATVRELQARICKDRLPIYRICPVESKFKTILTYRR